jgi:cohesin complex subunit SA-1/2
VRCCGLSVDINEDEAMDVDGIADVVERIEEESAKVSPPLLVAYARPSPPSTP